MIYEDANWSTTGSRTGAPGQMPVVPPPPPPSALRVPDEVLFLDYQGAPIPVIPLEAYLHKIEYWVGLADDRHRIYKRLWEAMTGVLVWATTATVLAIWGWVR